MTPKTPQFDQRWIVISLAVDMIGVVMVIASLLIKDLGDLKFPLMIVGLIVALGGSLLILRGRPRDTT